MTNDNKDQGPIQTCEVCIILLQKSSWKNLTPHLWGAQSQAISHNLNHTAFAVWETKAGAILPLSGENGG